MEKKDSFDFSIVFLKSENKGIKFLYTALLKWWSFEILKQKNGKHDMCNSGILPCSALKSQSALMVWSLKLSSYKCLVLCVFTIGGEELSRMQIMLNWVVGKNGSASKKNPPRLIFLPHRAVFCGSTGDVNTSSINPALDLDMSSIKSWGFFLKEQFPDDVWASDVIHGRHICKCHGQGGGVAPVLERIKFQGIQYLCLKAWCLWKYNRIETSIKTFLTQIKMTARGLLEKLLI